MSIRFTSLFGRCLCFCAVAFSSPAVGQIKILFDATKGEMAGNADWVIDYDVANVGVGSSGAYTAGSATKSNPQRIPTPAQSGITASTSGTYWQGGISSWGVDCAKRGYTVETLPWNAQITYGNTSNAQDLSNYKVYVIDEPNLRFSAAEKTAIINFVQNGGGLFIVADHEGSDRNGDGYDSRMVWNDLFNNNSVSVNPFGIYFDSVDISQTSTNVVAAAADPVIHGPIGNVTKVQWSGGTTMTLNTTKNPTILGVVFEKTASAGTNNVLVAYGKYGSGRIAAMGDSSPADDNTGNPTCSLYDGYLGDASGNHRPLIMNMTIWLAAETTSNVGVANHDAPMPKINVFPNPSTGTVCVATDMDLQQATFTVYGVAGNIVDQKFASELMKGSNITFNLGPGFYWVKADCASGSQTMKVVVY